MTEWEKIACLLVVFGISVGISCLIVRDKKRRDRCLAHPIKDQCLKPAGESLRQMIAGKDEEVDTVLFMILLCMVVGSIAILGIPAQLNVGAIALLTVFISTTVTLAFASIKLRRLIHERWNLRLGFEGERYVGQKLVDELMPHGFRVYHDLVFEKNGRKFNIDHVVVGRNGIFAIETKTWRKPVDPVTREIAREVTLEGESLKVPWPLKDSESEKALDQASRSAETLHDALFGRGDAVNQVIPVLALPGWKIDLQKYGEVAVINSRNSFNYFSKAGRNNYSDEILKLVTTRMETLAAMDADE